MNLNLKSPPGQVTVQSLVLINNPINPHRYYSISRIILCNGADRETARLSAANIRHEETPNWAQCAVAAGTNPHNGQ